MDCSRWWDTFEGDENQWAECFFSNPEPYDLEAFKKSIIDFCKCNDMEVIIVDEKT